MLKSAIRPFTRALVPAFGSALLFAGGLNVGSARSQDVFGMLEAHSAMSAQAQYAARMHSAYSNRDDDQDRPTRSPPSPRLTPAELARLEASARAERAEKDARYERWRKGYWDFFQSRELAGPGEYCAAMFQGPQGMITLSGFDKSWDGGLLMFTGENVPQPRSFRKVTATLTQTGEAPAKVQVFNYARDPRMYGFGTLVFAVPTMQAAVDGMEEEQEFAVSIDGREVFRMAWKGGLQAGKELRKCLRNR